MKGLDLQRTENNIRQIPQKSPETHYIDESLRHFFIQGQPNCWVPPGSPWNQHQPLSDGRVVFGTADGIQLLEEFDNTIRLAKCLNRLRQTAEAELQRYSLRNDELEAENQRLMRELNYTTQQESMEGPLSDPPVDQRGYIRSVLGTGLVGSATQGDMTNLLVKSYQRWAQVRFRVWWALWRDDPYWVDKVAGPIYYAGEDTNEIVHNADLVQDFFAARCSSLAETSLDVFTQTRASGELFGASYRMTIKEAHALSKWRAFADACFANYSSLVCPRTKPGSDSIERRLVVFLQHSIHRCICVLEGHHQKHDLFQIEPPWSAEA